MTTFESLAWCKKHNVRVKSASFDGSTLWFAQMRFRDEMIGSIFRNYTGAVTRLQCKLQEKTRKEVSS